MNIYFAVLLFAVALVLVIKGGDFLVDSSLWMAKITKIPPMIIGATVVSIATTLPEVLVSTIAVIKGTEAYGIAVGNAAGSMISNIALILGLSALLAPSSIAKKSFNEKALILALCSVILFVFSFTGLTIGLVEGIVLLVLFASFMTFNIIDGNKERKIETANSILDYEAARKENKILMISLFLLGAVLIGVGANLLVENGLYISGFFGISADLMGLTFVAIGTSLPELVTTIKSIRKNTASLGIGNILGANIINSTLLLGLCGSIAGASGGLTITSLTICVTIPFLLLITAMLIIPTFIKGKTMRWQGAMLLLTYLVYMAIMIMFELKIF